MGRPRSPDSELGGRRLEPLSAHRMSAPLEAFVFLPCAPQSRGLELGELSPAPRTNGRSHLLRKRTALRIRALQFACFIETVQHNTRCQRAGSAPHVRYAIFHRLLGMGTNSLVWAGQVRAHGFSAALLRCSRSQSA